MGPAGCGKSTYCATLQRHLEASHRRVHIINLDPAAEHFDYPVTWDVRDVISVDDVAETLQYGPNGGLIYCMEFLLSNLEVLEEALGSYEDDYLVFDCPGQIELYTHIPVMRRLVDWLQEHAYRVVGLYLLDAQFMDDSAKFFAGILSATATMLQLEIPHVNAMSKMDLIHPSQRADLDKFLDPDPRFLASRLNEATTPRHRALNEAIGSLCEDFSLVRFVPLDRTDTESIQLLLLHLDRCLQYGEDEDVREPRDEGEDGEEGGEGNDGAGMREGPLADLPF